MLTQQSACCEGLQYRCAALWKVYLQVRHGASLVHKRGPGSTSDDPPQPSSTRITNGLVYDHTCTAGEVRIELVGLWWRDGLPWYGILCSNLTVLWSAAFDSNPTQPWPRFSKCLTVQTNAEGQTAEVSSSDRWVVCVDGRQRVEHARCICDVNNGTLVVRIQQRQLVATSTLERCYEAIENLLAAL
jgi:hypothetical protein